MPLKPPSYDPPEDVELGVVPVSRFSGEPDSGVLAGSSGALFFSPALLEENVGTEVEIDSIGVTVHGSDVYLRPQELSRRVFTWGPGGTSRTNNPLFRTQPKEYTVIATLVQTIPPGPTTIIKIP
jgi:hypothetical protein